LLGNPIPAYLAGLRPYYQQIIHTWTLVPSEDDFAVARSGVWGRRQVEEWLGRDAPYALIDLAELDNLEQLESYGPLVRQIRTLLERHFTLVATVGEVPWTRVLQVYRRHAAARSA
jgi:hypothetical protein